MRVFLFIFLVILALAILILAGLFWYSYKPAPKQITYGMSFNVPYARELGLDWKKTYDAMLDELGVRELRLAAHWPLVEPTKDVFNFTELDYQLDRAAAVNAHVILAVGRRLPRWPECHIPDWAQSLSWEEQQAEILAYMDVVVNRYKDHRAVVSWQLENEPYLEVFAKDYCGDFDEVFLERELAHLRSLDSTRPILITDSGNLGRWSGAYRHGDYFGTSVYVYFWNPEFGQFRTILPAWSYWLKEGLMRLRYGEKETVLIELSAEPWLIEPITDVTIETQFTRMDLAKFEEILTYAKATRFARQYLWGVEWWYWLKQHGHPEFWERGQELFNGSKLP